MKIAIGADPFAYDLKKAVEGHLRGRGAEVLDADGYSGRPYYEVAEAAAKSVASGGADGAVLFCGTGAGMAIVANKVRGIRAVCVESVFAAKKARAINDANVVSMGAMIVGGPMACEMVDAWIDTGFAEGFEQLKEFLGAARSKVAEIDAANRSAPSPGE